MEKHELQTIDLQELIRTLDDSTVAEMRYLLRSLSPAETSNLIESSPPNLRRLIWQLVESGERSNQVLQFLGDDVRAEFLQSMDTDRLAAAASELDADDFADILQQLPGTISSQVLDTLDEQQRNRVELILSYPEDSAGGLMDTDIITVRPRHTLRLVLRYLRRLDRLPAGTDSLWVVNSRHEYVGNLPLSRILTTDADVTVREVMDTDLEPMRGDLPDTEVARIFAEQDLLSAPVVDEQDRVLGRVTIDDVVDVIIEDADEALLARAGLEVDEDTFGPILKSARRRAVWLGINLGTAFMAAAVINLFEETIAQVVALAVLMPIVASMGGIAGTQTLTLVVRGMALGQIGYANLGWLLNRELIVAAINGVLWAAFVAAAAALFFNDATLGIVIATALVINMLVAAISGALLPSILNSLGIDPAIAGGVILTTVTDIAGFGTFLGLATYAYG